MYALNGQFKQAHELLSNFSGPGFTLNKLYIQCLEHKSISDVQLDNIGMELRQYHRIYELSGLIKLANLGLDNNCHFSSDQFIKLLDRALERNFYRVKQKQNIMVYKAHYQYINENLEAAITTAHQAYLVNKENPSPLAMAIEWLSESDQTELANVYMQNLVTHSEENGGRYERLIIMLEKNISDR